MFEMNSKEAWIAYSMIGDILEMFPDEATEAEYNLYKRLDDYFEKEDDNG